MKSSTISAPILAISAAFFLGWLGILYVGADHPPPPGFLLLVLIDLLAAGLVYWRVPTYKNWARELKKNRWFLALLEGTAAGLAIAGMVLVFPGTGEPGVQPSFTDYMVWLAVSGVVGATNAGLVYGLSAYLSRKTTT
jgi:hypothetical protein